MLKLVLLLAILHVSSGASWVLSLGCQLNLAIGALTAIAKTDYKVMKEEFFLCEELMLAVENMPELDFNDIDGPTNAIHNLNQISNLLKVIEPPFDRCPFKMPPEEKAKIKELFAIFTDPSAYKMTDMSLKAVQNWSTIEEDSKRAIDELSQSHCARSGYIYGKTMKKVMDTELNVGKIANEAFGKGMQKLGSMFGNMFGGVAKNEETAAQTP